MLKSCPCTKSSSLLSFLSSLLSPLSSSLFSLLSSSLFSLLPFTFLSSPFSLLSSPSFLFLHLFIVGEDLNTAAGGPNETAELVLGYFEAWVYLTLTLEVVWRYIAKETMRKHLSKEEWTSLFFDSFVFFFLFIHSFFLLTLLPAFCCLLILFFLTYYLIIL